MSDKYHLHFVSNATGETIHSVARACLSQSDVIEAEEHHWSLVPPVGQIERVLANIKEKGFFEILEETRTYESNFIEKIKKDLYSWK